MVTNTPRDRIWTYAYYQIHRKGTSFTKQDVVEEKDVGEKTVRETLKSIPFVKNVRRSDGTVHYVPNSAVTKRNQIQ